MSRLHEKLWAKSPDKSANPDGIGESLFQHSLNVKENTQRICERLPFPAEKRHQLAELLLQAGVVHDLGKAASGFQKMLRMSRKEILENRGWRHRHETLSTALAYVLNPNFDEAALFAVLTHHKDIPKDERDKRCLPSGELPPNFFHTNETIQWSEMLTHLRENWVEFQDLLEHLASELKLNWISIPQDCELMNLGLDDNWLYRDEQRKNFSKDMRWQASLLRGLLMTSDHLASAIDPSTGKHPDIQDIPFLNDSVDSIKEKELPENADLLPFQQRSAETNGNAILKAPTGSGKTLAAMLWASNNQEENARLFYVLPFTASINAMSDRFKSIFEKNKELVGVLHHRNADYLFRMLEEDELSVQLQNQQAKHLQSLAKEMYHPIRITTPHQILRFTLRGRGWETGLAEFYNGCFIFDEIHAFEPLITGLTLATAKLLKSKNFNAKILFTSATIPKFLEKLIKEHLEIEELNVIEPNPDSDDKIVCEKKRHKIQIRGGNLFDNLPEIVREILADGKPTLIFCNHVKTSQQIYDKLQDEYGFCDVTLLHSRFNGRDRTAVEKKITHKKSEEEEKSLKELIAENPRNTPILVATQAVEVSLDIDFEAGYSEPAPADALGQRFGRINRKGSRPPENIVIFEEPTNGYLYDEELTKKTVELFREKIEPLSEKDLTEIVDKVYENGYSEAANGDFQKGLTNTDIINFAENIIAGTHNDWTDQIFDRADAQIEVLPQCLLDLFLQFKKNKQYIEAKRLLVPIRMGTYYKAKSLSAVIHNSDLREHIVTLNYNEPDIDNLRSLLAEEHIVTLDYNENRGLDSDKLDNQNII